MDTSFSLWEKVYRENPVFITGMGLQFVGIYLQSSQSATTPTRILTLNFSLPHGMFENCTFACLFQECFSWNQLEFFSPKSILQIQNFFILILMLQNCDRFFKKCMQAKILNVAEILMNPIPSVNESTIDSSKVSGKFFFL